MNLRYAIRSLSLFTVLVLALLFASSCSNLTGWRIPGTEKGAGATTTVYLVLENVETLPEHVRSLGEIYVDDAYFGRTSRPAYYPYVGNKLVVGTVQIQKEKLHTISVVFPDYRPFEVTRYFGTLPEYAVTFSLQQEASAAASMAVPEEAQEKEWYKFW